MTHEQEAAKVIKLIGEVQVGTFTTLDGAGRLVRRPMAVLKVEDDGDLRFVTNGKGREVGLVIREARVNVGFAPKSSWVPSVPGTKASHRSRHQVLSDVIYRNGRNSSAAVPCSGWSRKKRWQ